MKSKALSLCRGFLNFLSRDAVIDQDYAKIGDLLLTFKLLSTPHLSSESKLTYAYLFFHRHDVNGCKIPVLCKDLSMTPGQARGTLKELENKNHIKLITALRNDDLSNLAYYYDIVDPNKYGMLDLENEQCPVPCL